MREFKVSHPSVAKKIERDATMTTGASWKSQDAGLNRILRWVMLLSDDELLDFGINMSQLKPQVIAKLREKAASYVDCIEVAKKLTWLAYQMLDAPQPLAETSAYLVAHFEPMIPGSTTCIVCRKSLSFNLFAEARRGRAEIETGHMNPRSHKAHNVGFVHRECNIAQGQRTLQEFYSWIREILERAESNPIARNPDVQNHEVY
ncbi:MAG TPA: hypothetical protein DCP31_22990 [Cyanobacteria bacterium UBA8543]|nr:hypothetical protein [Cyanobacteria bacterium UBA8543]